VTLLIVDDLLPQGVQLEYEHVTFGAPVFTLLYMECRDQDLSKGSIPRQTDGRYDTYDKHDTRQFLIVMAFTIH
jgi:hypothetical protein